MCLTTKNQELSNRPSKGKVACILLSGTYNTLTSDGHALGHGLSQLASLLNYHCSGF